MFEFHETTIAPLVECPTATGKSFWAPGQTSPPRICLASSESRSGGGGRGAPEGETGFHGRDPGAGRRAVLRQSNVPQGVPAHCRWSTHGRLAGTLTPESTENSRGGEGQPGARLGADRDPRLPRQRRLVMTRIPIAPPGMKDQRPRYTLGWRVGNHIYVAGQLPFDKDGNLLGKGDIKAQTRRIFEQIKMIVEAGGGKMDDVVKVTVFVTDVRYREPYGEVRSEFFGPNPPASTLVQIGNLAIPDALIEIEAVAALDG